MNKRDRLLIVCVANLAVVVYIQIDFHRKLINCNRTKLYFYTVFLI